ncbi:metallo-beta-lactamase superfamily protein [Blastomyces dermatitidis ER-3]|uniref:Metallo-beta-lactamase superfamily protein n=1 Tax=Ajellomyces dermatitidis (strain ER-3 / ATCC MYA-2586) TaxID=559297 RepID=A0ABP2F7E9_AJEDR|nr:metallo-beta-lactamase superfamily protein [Blastomyces dermatitidis ER-3]EEQ92147.2 metallo-beta-lactamase superfamily protein [Blastomyces dermatitidis ER-3]
MSSSLVEIDALEAVVVIDNELDLMSPPAPGPVKVSRLIGEIGLTSPHHIHDRAEATKEFRLEDVCCSAHGLSVLLTAVKGEERRTILFDIGPTEESWARNAERLRLDLSSVERIQLSHWHRDHSGGMLKAIRMINEAKKGKGLPNDDLVVDLHPSRPDYRGIQMGKEIVSLEADPTFQEIEQAGAKVENHDETHTVLGNMFLISGEIPRKTEYETGLKYGVRFDQAAGKWDSDELIVDERFLACNIKGKGIVVFSGCSHAGIVNATRHAIELIGKDHPVYAIFGGYHLAMSDKAQMNATVKGLKELDPKVLLPGHCSGWRVKYEIEKEMPGRLVPSSVGFKLGF